MIDWANDPDWYAIVQSANHAQHHLHIDRYGVTICRECSKRQLYVLSEAELKRLLIMERAS